MPLPSKGIRKGLMSACGIAAAAGVLPNLKSSAPARPAVAIDALEFIRKL
jgi:hypothetical protein